VEYSRRNELGETSLASIISLKEKEANAAETVRLIQ
jgi:hypothetical protein